VGKTRLAAEVARIAQRSLPPGYDGSGGARVLAVRCAAYGERWRLGPLADLVRAVVGLPDPTMAPPTHVAPKGPLTRVAAEERLRRVSQAIARRTGAPPRLPTDQLLALLGLPPDPGSDRGGTDRAGGRSGPRVGRPGGGSGDDAYDHVELDGDREPTGLAAPSPGDDAAARARPKDEAPTAVARLISALARDAPVVVIVDDLHDASPATVDALGAMLGRLAGPVLVVLLGRPELVRTAGALTRLADAEVHQLTPLRGAEMSRLLTAYLDAWPAHAAPTRHGGRLPASDTDRLLATAQGNPFYLSELVTLLVERGALTGDGGAWRLAPGSLSGRLLSRDLAAVLAARIDALPATSRALLRDAAVVGDMVPAAALAAVREQGSARDSRPATVATEELDLALGELLHRRMLLPSRGGFSFATPLLREAAYAGVGKADLADRHARLARWAARLAGSRQRPDDDTAPAPNLGWSPETLDAFIAEQAERAGGLADAVSLRPDASARAVARLGVAALGRLARRALLAGEPGQAAEFGVRARRVATGELPAVDRLSYASALLQLGRAGDALSELDAVLEGVAAGDEADAGIRARALLLAGRAHLAQGDTGQGDAALARALRVAIAAGLPTERAEALRRIGMEDYRRGRLVAAEAGFREALRIAQSSADRRGEAWALQNLAWVQTTLGDFAGAETTLSRAARLFAELGNTTGRAWLRGTTAFTRLLAGRLDEARRLAAAFLPFGERVGERWAVGTLRAVAAFASAELGELTEADAQARQAFAEFDAVDDDWGRALALVVRGAVARALGEPGRAIDLLDDACRHGQRTGHPLLLGIAHTVRGFTALDAGDTAMAESDARTVLEVVSSSGVWNAARVGPRVLFGRTLLAKQDVGGAVEVLGEVAASVLDGEPASLLFSPRQAVAEYADALLAADRVDEALATARRALELPAEDVRGRTVAERVLARAQDAAGDHAARVVPA
jgi:tetratricopeptide (TPR) repeat protein